MDRRSNATNSPNAKETEVFRTIVHGREFRDDDHTATEYPGGACTGDCTTEDEDVHPRSDGGDEGTELEDGDGEHDDVFGWEDLAKLGVHEVEAQEGQAGQVSVCSKCNVRGLTRSRRRAMGVG